MTQILCRELTIKFRQTVALQSVDLNIEGDQIVGILGRKGSGKTTLLSLLSALKYPSSGSVTVDGEDPYENSKATTNICFTWAGQRIKKRGNIRKTLKFCSKLRPSWDMDYANELLSKFGLDETMKIKKLNPDETALLNLINGLASRAAVTIFDGTYLDLTDEHKKIFFSEIEEDHKKNPRTIILSTDNADEIQPMLEDVIIFDRGYAISHATTEEIVTKAKELMKADKLPTLQEVLMHFTKEGGGQNEQ